MENKELKEDGLYHGNNKTFTVNQIKSDVEKGYLIPFED